jgi:hypothetical protein
MTISIRVPKEKKKNIWSWWRPRIEREKWRKKKSWKKVSKLGEKIKFYKCCRAWCRVFRPKTLVCRPRPSSTCNVSTRDWQAREIFNKDRATSKKVPCPTHTHTHVPRKGSRKKYGRKQAAKSERSEECLLLLHFFHKKKKHKKHFCVLCVPHTHISLSFVRLPTHG